MWGSFLENLTILENGGSANREPYEHGVLETWALGSENVASCGQRVINLWEQITLDIQDLDLILPPQKKKITEQTEEAGNHRLLPQE